MTQMQGNAVSQEVLSKCPIMWIRASRTCGLCPLSLYLCLHDSNSSYLCANLPFKCIKSRRNHNQYLFWALQITIHVLNEPISIYYTCILCTYCIFIESNVCNPQPPKKDFVMLQLTRAQGFHLYAVKQLTVWPFQPAVDVRITCHSGPGILWCWTGIPPTLLTVFFSLAVASDSSPSNWLCFQRGQFLSCTRVNVGPLRFPDCLSFVFTFV